MKNIALALATLSSTPVALHHEKILGLCCLRRFIELIFAEYDNVGKRNTLVRCAVTLYVW